MSHKTQTNSSTSQQCHTKHKLTAVLKGGIIKGLLVFIIFVEISSYPLELILFREPIMLLISFEEV
jgi:hypothetical protein